MKSVSRATQREVLIPLVAAATGSLGRVAADWGLPPPHVAQLEPSISELLEVGLYAAGQTARASVRHQLGLRFRHPMASGLALYPLNPGDFLGLDEDNSDSAQLGLALAWLMCRAQSTLRTVFASGALRPVPGRREVEVRSVAHLAQKLALLSDHLLRPGAPPAPALALIPVRDLDGSSTRERYSHEIARLHALGTRVLPVSTLAEAAAAVGAINAWTPPAWRAAFAAGTCGLVLALGWYAHTWWVQRPLALQFSSVLDTGGQAWMTPARAVTVPGQALRLGPLCQGQPPSLLDGENLALSVSVADDHDQTAELHYAVAAVSPSALKVLPLTAPTSGTLRTLVPVPGPPEPTLLAVLAWRRAADLGSVEQRLRRQMEGLAPSERIAHARHLLTQAAPGALLYMFESVDAKNDRSPACGAL